ncbi:MAG: sulfite exporter TauE/SafE family protein [Anaerolineae bacterium]|nr:sulfite exporter TauE/SafE family protein [Anaerolineae bacterium]
MEPLSLVWVAVIAFALEVIDSALGMGYGTILTPVLLLIGYDPLLIVPAVIGSQLVGDVLSVVFHHQFKNVDLSPRSNDFRVGATLAVFSLLGSVTAVLFALKISKFALNLYIGVLVFVVGIVVLANRDRDRDFSWVRLFFLGSIASFNKGLSGGGYGPIVTSGQLLTGVNVRAAIGITALAEGVTCVAALVTYLLAGMAVDWGLMAAMSVGVALSTPLAALIVSKLQPKHLKLIIGVFTIAMGTLTIIKTVRVL